MSVFRRLSTRRLVLALGSAVAAAVTAAALAATLTGGAGAAPAGEPLAQAIHDALAGTPPPGVTARVQFTNNLLPSSSSLLGNVTSALLSGASGRLWLTNDGQGRIELQSDAGDTQIVWNPSKVSVYDASSNTAYELALPSHAEPSSGTPTVPSLDAISSALSKLEQHANVSDAEPLSLAGQPAYQVSVSPEENGGLLGDAELGWDASNGTPLRFAITAKGDSTPVLALDVTDISYGAVSSSDVAIPPPAGAKVVDLSPPAGGTSDSQTPVTGIDAVRAAVSFPLVAPDSVNGMPLSSARLVGKGALLTYGEGLGALVVHERAADGGSSSASMLGSLPKVSLGPVSATELATPLGTALSFDNAGVSFVVAGSMTSADAEAAAKLFA